MKFFSIKEITISFAGCYNDSESKKDNISNIVIKESPSSKIKYITITLYEQYQK